MASTIIPTEAPPPYTPNPSSSNTTAPPFQDGSHLQVPQKTRSGIPPATRRSMEDEARELPEGWVRQYDHKSHHQFFVDTRTDPPRSIWHHPYDDDTYMNSLSSAERERIKNIHQVPNKADMEAESSADEHDDYHAPSSSGTGAGTGVATEEHLSGPKKFGRKLKDKLTNSTHEERVAARLKREEEERRMYAQHQHIRRQMSLAAETGQPQLLGKDSQGKDVYVEPPEYGYEDGFGGGFGGYSGGRGYGYNPYNQGPYANPNARFIKPPQPYGRPYGYGYGGGYGLPIGLGLGGGLLLGGLLF